MGGCRCGEVVAGRGLGVEGGVDVVALCAVEERGDAGEGAEGVEEGCGGEERGVGGFGEELGVGYYRGAVRGFLVLGFGLSFLILGLVLWFLGRLEALSAGNGRAAGDWTRRTSGDGWGSCPSSCSISSSVRSFERRNSTFFSRGESRTDSSSRKRLATSRRDSESGGCDKLESVLVSETCDAPAAVSAPEACDAPASAATSAASCSGSSGLFSSEPDMVCDGMVSWVERARCGGQVMVGVGKTREVGSYRACASASEAGTELGIRWRSRTLHPTPY